MQCISYNKAERAKGAKKEGTKKKGNRFLKERSKEVRILPTETMNTEQPKLPNTNTIDIYQYRIFKSEQLCNLKQETVRELQIWVSLAGQWSDNHKKEPKNICLNLSKVSWNKDVSRLKIIRLKWPLTTTN